MARFFRRGVSKIGFVPTLATSGTLSAADLASEVDLSDDIAEVNGFQLTNSPIPTPNLGAAFTPQIEGEDTVSDSALVFYDDDVAEVIRDTLTKGTAGYILLFPYGRVVGKRAEIWQVRSNGVNDEWSVGNDPARTAVPFSISSVPVQDAEVPAAA